MREGNFSAFARKYDGLGVDQQAGARRRIAHVPDGDIPLGQRGERPARKHVGNQAHTLIVFHLIRVRDGDAAAFLAAVLKGVQAVIHGVGDVARFRGIHPEYAALLVHTVEHGFRISQIHSPFFLKKSSFCDTSASFRQNGKRLFTGL